MIPWVGETGVVDRDLVQHFHYRIRIWGPYAETRSEEQVTQEQEKLKNDLKINTPNES